MTMLFWLSRTNRQFPMSGHVDAFRIAKRSGLSLRSMTAAILISSGLTVFLAFWAYLSTLYRVGYESAHYDQMILNAFGSEPWTRLNGWLTSPSPPDPARAGAYVVGAAVVFLLSMLRVRFTWWPLHPLGYVASGSHGLLRLWVPLLIAWLCKTVIIRYGGLSTYRRWVPFFLGLICGEFVIGMLVTLAGLCGLFFPPQSGIGGL